jgi:hypothetical protein
LIIPLSVPVGLKILLEEMDLSGNPPGRMPKNVGYSEAAVRKKITLKTT